MLSSAKLIITHVGLKVSNITSLSQVHPQVEYENGQVTQKATCPFQHKLSTKIIRENQVVCIESLQVKNMVKNHKLAKAISDVGWSEFVRQLEYKAEWYGRMLVKIDTFYPSSKRCFNCGHILDSLSLAIRSWTCPQGGVCHVRDINAAQNNCPGTHGCCLRRGRKIRCGENQVWQASAKQESLSVMRGSSHA